ncbi:DUF6163 family protein [Flexibacterium corallicola]|uniref:DUF6163 family protein n=1 Tax=Flexibacterium corallicola TaxID=3037259 RepID=UPI00286F8B80|nr:DUF6163 family protein [Pseudovibrio sp. M1P-2-3]
MLWTVVEFLKSGSTFTRILHVYLRVLAAVSIASGIYQWSHIIGLSNWDGLFFSQVPIELQSATIFFAVLNLVAAVGLWLLANWGTVIWLFLALSQVVMHTMFAAIYGRQPLEISFFIIAVALYLLLLYLSERETRG